MAFYGVNYWKNNALEQNAYSLLKKWSVLLHSKKKKKKIRSFIIRFTKEAKMWKDFPEFEKHFL